jgi:hypothetical protein
MGIMFLDEDMISKTLSVLVAGLALGSLNLASSRRQLKVDMGVEASKARRWLPLSS